MPKKWQIHRQVECPHCKALARRRPVSFTWPPLGEAEMYELRISVPRGFPIASPFSRETQE